ncbi:hypothetical protein ACA910_018710 [Epithemia clementina (nom. ined.)]
MATAAATRVEDQLKEQLNLKYSAASKLIQEARNKSRDDISDEDLVKVAAASFHKNYNKKQQEEMRVPADGTDKNGGEEPEWQRKARLAAERREQEWQAAANGETLPEAPKLPPNVVSQTVTKRVGSDPAPVVVESLSQEIPLKEPNEENTRKTICYCVIL